MIVLILPRLRDPLEISVANALGRARMRQAIRLYGIGRDENKLTKKDPVTIEADDVLKSRVFEGASIRNESPPTTKLAARVIRHG